MSENKRKSHKFINQFFSSELGHSNAIFCIRMNEHSLRHQPRKQRKILINFHFQNRYRRKRLIFVDTVHVYVQTNTDTSFH